MLFGDYIAATVGIFVYSSLYTYCVCCVLGSWLGTGETHMTVFLSSSSRIFQVQIRAPLLTSCVTLGKLLNPIQPQFFQL